MQNIGAANADDAFYRYKMPKLVAKIEGRGNGIKTNVVNNVDVAKALERPPEYTLKFFGLELGAQTNFDAKTGTSIVNGAHDMKKLSEILEGFIKRYVCCYSCNNPETVVKIKKEMIHLKCKACGYVSDVDMRHKLNTFILKNPPPSTLKKEEKQIKKAEAERLRDAEMLGDLPDEKKKEKKEKKDKDKDKGEKKDKKEKKEKKDKKKKKKEGEEGADDGDDKSNSNEDGEDEEEEEEEAAGDDGVVWMTDTSTEAAKRRAEAQLTAATAALVTVGNIEAEEEAARKRAEKKAADEAKAKADEEAALAAAASDPVLKMRLLLAKDPAAAAAEVKAFNVEGGLAGKMRVLYEAAFGGNSDKLPDILRSKKAVFAAHAKDPQSQLAQLIAFEYVLAVALPERAIQAPHALKEMYELDLIDEDIITAWAGKADAGRILGVPADAAKSLREKVAPVVEWLAEDDDDDDDEDDE